jgi:hypothetical protein
MDKRAQFSDVARRLRRAAQAADWSAVGAIDREIAHLLRWMQHTESAAERLALEELRRAHSEVRSCCEREANRLNDVLQKMRTHRDGWMAYAMSDAQDPQFDEILR